MKPRSKKQSSVYNEHDLAVMDLSSEFDGLIANDFDYIDLDAKAEVDFNDDENFY